MSAPYTDLPARLAAPIVGWYLIEGVYCEVVATTDAHPARAAVVALYRSSPRGYTLPMDQARGHIAARRWRPVAAPPPEEDDRRRERADRAREWCRRMCA